ncbi:MAG: hypothetical protein WA962_00140 [Ornithinimicrobium sp.]
MNDIVSAVVLISLSLLSLAAIGWFAMPKPERGRVGDLTRSDGAAMIKTGARVLASWGPRLDFEAPTTAASPTRSAAPSAHGSDR